MFEVYIKADGPEAEKVMAIAEVLQQIKDLAVDTTAVEASFANETRQIVAAFDQFKTEAASLRETISNLQSQIANGGGVTEADLQAVLDSLRARDQKIIEKADAIYTPDAPPETPPAPPAGTGE